MGGGGLCIPSIHRMFTPDPGIHNISHLIRRSLSHEEWLIKILPPHPSPTPPPHPQSIFACVVTHTPLNRKEKSYSVCLLQLISAASIGPVPRQNPFSQSCCCSKIYFRTFILSIQKILQSKLSCVVFIEAGQRDYIYRKWMDGLDYRFMEWMDYGFIENGELEYTQRDICLQSATVWRVQVCRASPDWRWPRKIFIFPHRYKTSLNVSGPKSSGIACVWPFFAERVCWLALKGGAAQSVIIIVRNAHPAVWKGD